MKLSIYKWSQYYLMYSPIWKQLNKKNHMNQQKDISSYGYYRDNRMRDKFESMNSKQDKYDKIVSQLRSQQSMFNIRLSIAYKLLMLQQNKQSFVLSQSKKEQKPLEMNKLQKDNQYWSKQKQRLNNIIQQFLVMAKNFTHNNKSQQQTNYLNKLISKLFDKLQNQQLLQNKQVLKPIITNNNPTVNTQQLQVNSQQLQQSSSTTLQDHQNNSQEKRENNQKVYKINQLTKRLFINQLVKQLRNQDENKTIQHKIIQLSFITKLIDTLFKQKLIQLQQQQLNDWLHTLLQQTQIITHLYSTTIKLVKQIISPDSKTQTQTINNNINNITFSQIQILLQLYQLFKSLKINIKGLLNSINTQNKQKGVQPQLYQSLQNVLNKLSISKHSQTNYKLNHKSIATPIGINQIQKLFTLKQLIYTYISLAKGQSTKDHFFKLLNKLNSFNSTNTQQQQQQQSSNKRKTNKQNNKNQNININKHIKQQNKQQTGLRYNLWKLSQLIKRKSQIKTFQQKYSIGITEIDIKIINYFESQISSTIQSISTKINISLTNKKPNRQQQTNNKVQIQDIFYLGSLVKYLLKSQQQQHISSLMKLNNNQKTITFTKLLYKISEQCNRKILNFDIQQIIDKKENTVSIKCIQILNNLINNYYNQQPFLNINSQDKQIQTKQQEKDNNNCIQLNKQNALIYASQSQLLSKLIKLLQNYLLTNKQYIFLEHKQHQQLKFIIKFILSVNQKHMIINQQSLSSINKILNKLT